MQDLDSLIAKYVDQPIWAVVGASNDQAKYGNRIYLKLRESGYTVYPVNRRAPLIEGDTAYSKLTDLPEPPTVVNMVVPPTEAPLIVENAKAAGAQAIWFQPGAESTTAARWAQDNGLDVIEACILVQLALRPRPDKTQPDQPASHSRPVTTPDPTTSTR